MAKRKRRNFTAEFKTEVVLKPCAVKVRKQNSVGDITSAKTKSRSGSSSSLKMRCLCLLARISSRARRRGVLLTLNTSSEG